MPDNNETEVPAIKAGILKKTKFKDEQERAEAYAEIYSISQQAAESIKGEQGELGPVGPAGKVNISTEEHAIPSGALEFAVPTGNIETAFLHLKKEGLAGNVQNVGIGSINGSLVTFVFGGTLTQIPDATYSLIVNRFV